MRSLIIGLSFAAIFLYIKETNSQEQNDEYTLRGSQKQGRTLIPGTKWCGNGNASTADNPYGIFKGLDKCCEQHDGCSDYISTGQTKYGLKNTGTLTKVLCECDNNLYKCLKSDNSLASNFVGQLYFNTMQPTCFQKHYPVKQCIKYSRMLFYKRCVAYKYNRHLPKEYKFFDNPYFFPSLL